MSETKGRKAMPAAPAATVELNHEALADGSNALTVLGSRNADIADRFGDGQPYDRSRIVSEVRFFMAASAEAMFELGKRLIVLKENEPHGEFQSLITDVLGIPYRTAARFMAVALKLSGMPDSKVTSLALLGKTKLFDLLDESADDIEGLAEGGTIAGHNLDEIQAMSARELRAALLETKKRIVAKDAVIAKKDQKLNALTEAEERRRSGSPSEREQAQLDDVRSTGLAAEMAVRQLLAAAGAVVAAPATEAAATAAHAAVGFVAQVLAGLINERGLVVDLADMLTPHWLAGVDAQVGNAHAKRSQG